MHSQPQGLMRMVPALNHNLHLAASFQLVMLAVDWEEVGMTCMAHSGESILDCRRTSTVEEEWTIRLDLVDSAQSLPTWAIVSEMEDVC